MFIGADYYPEHWPRERWETDMKLMQDAGFNIVRLAEFDWVHMEPAEGEYRFAFWDEVLSLLQKYGISAILCTPTAVMPAWVARKYPETLATNPDGSRQVWGVRKNNCFASGTYRLLSERITRAMAEHFANVPNVVAWQTDNEFGHPNCYCNSCRVSFQDWLRVKYGTLEKLNTAWGTHFWGHLIQDWAEITIPVDRNSHNPSACLDWQRHSSWQNVQFQADQVNILRQHCPKLPITHNFMGTFEEINYYDLARDLDFVSWDNYPLNHTSEARPWSSMAADLMRGLKGKNFWIMEQSAGPLGWGTYGRNTRPGEIRNISYQQWAHGADSQLWFRWRSCTVGREQYWHGLLGHDAKPGRRYAEAAKTAREFHQLAPLMQGTTVKAKVAIIYDYDSLWAVRIQPGYDNNRYVSAVQRYYDAFFRAGINVDMVRPGTDLSSYQVVLTPDLYILPDSLADQLVRYVQSGGLLLADSRTGVKDETGLCHVRTLPGKLSAALGIEIPEYESICGDTTYQITGSQGLTGPYTAVQTCDWVKPTTAEVLAKYTPWHVEGYAAVTRNRFGAGEGWYVGTIAKESEFYDHLIFAICQARSIEPVVKPPAGVEVSVREGSGRTLLFIINQTDVPKTVSVPAGKKELLTGTITQSTLILDRCEVAVLLLQG